MVSFWGASESGCRVQVHSPVGNFRPGAPGPNDVRDLGAGPRGFPEGVPLPGRRGPRVPVAATCRAKPRISVVLGAAGREGSRASPPPAQSRALPQPRASSHSSLHKGAPGRSLRSASQASLEGPRGPSLSFPRGPGAPAPAGAAPRSVAHPHPGTKPRSGDWRRGLDTSMAPGAARGLPRGRRAGTSQALEAPTPRATRVAKSEPAPGKIHEVSQARPGGGARSPNPGPSP